MARVYEVLPELAVTNGEGAAVYEVLPELVVAVEPQARVYEVLTEVLVTDQSDPSGGGVQGRADIQGPINIQGRRRGPDGSGMQGA